MTAFLFATGDVLAQQTVERIGIKNHDRARTGRMALYGGIVFGPVATGWYKFLQHRIVLPNKNVETLARVACDQAFFAPVHLGVFLSSMAVMEGSDPMAKINTAYFPAIINNLLVWPWVQLINFKYVPLQYRVLVVNVVALGWNCYLSYISSAGLNTKKVASL